MRPVTLEMICGAYPSQWEGKFDDGKMFYIRYRYELCLIGRI